MAHNKDQDIKVFKFGELRPHSAADVVSSYNPEKIDPSKEFKRNIPAEIIRGEREFEKNSSFKISDVVREHRGIKRQEEEDFEAQVEREVQRRLAQMAEETREEAYQQGLAKGREEAFEEGRIQIDSLVDNLKNEIDGIALQGAELLEKLIYEVNKKSHLVIRVNAEKFQVMPEIIQSIEAKLGTLTNVRVEISPELKYDGLILEAENTIVDGSLEAQFHSIDRIFEQIGVGNHDEL